MDDASKTLIADAVFEGRTSSAPPGGEAAEDLIVEGPLDAALLLRECQRMASIGTWSVDFATGAVLWTEETYRLYGLPLSAEAPRAENFLALIHEDDRPKMANWVRTAARGILPPPVIVRVPLADGTTRVLRGFGRIVRSPTGQLRGTLGTAQDVTEQYAALTALEASEARVRHLFEDATEGILKTGADGLVVAANPALAKMLGVASPEELLGKPMTPFYADPDQRTRLYAALRSVGYFGLVDIPMRRTDGTEVILEASGRAIHGGGSDPVYFQSCLHDVTFERRRAERERAASQAKTHFLANMSHELRTPLNAIMGLSEALLANAYGPLAPPQREHMDTIRESGRHLVGLVNDALDLARVEAGHLSLRREEFAVHPLIGECLAWVMDSVEARHQHVVREQPDDVTTLVGDPKRVRQILVNLLTNAVKFTPAGGTITVGVRRGPRETVEFWVKDSGPGIPLADRSRVFEPFVQLDTSLSRDGGGAGLGLALVQKFVELHGGTVRIEGGKDEGATFIVSFPAQKQASHDLASPQTQASRE